MQCQATLGKYAKAPGTQCPHPAKFGCFCGKHKKYCLDVSESAETSVSVSISQIPRNKSEQIWYSPSDFSQRKTVYVYGREPYKIVYTGDHFYCSCPAWKFQSLAPADRTCKHIKGLLGKKIPYFSSL